MPAHLGGFRVKPTGHPLAAKRRDVVNRLFTIWTDAGSIIVPVMPRALGIVTTRHRSLRVDALWATVPFEAARDHPPLKGTR